MQREECRRWCLKLSRKLLLQKMEENLGWSRKNLTAVVELIWVTWRRTSPSVSDVALQVGERANRWGAATPHNLSGSDQLIRLDPRCGEVDL